MLQLSNIFLIKLLRAIPLQFFRFVRSLLAPFGIGTIVDTEKEVGIKQCDNIQVHKRDMYSESNGDPFRK